MFIEIRMKMVKAKFYYASRFEAKFHYSIWFELASNQIA